MRSAYLVYLAAALGTVNVSAGPTIAKAEAYGECAGVGGIQTAKCPTGYRCDPVNPNYSQCVPDYYPPPEEQFAKREAAPVAEADSNNIEKRQSTTSTQITGAQSTSGRCYNRRKLQTLQTTYPDQFNMFILALESMQAVAENNDLSWFGISGIHGAPYIPWQQPADGNYNTRLGYCVHGSPLFVPWHRPYMLLIEQVMVSHAKTIAARFTGSRAAAYQTAADQLRFPYWDWSDPVTRSDVPAVMMQSTITVTKPNASTGAPGTVTIPNPLFQYNFKSAATNRQYFSGNYANWMSTTRNPLNTANPPTSRNDVANTAMRNSFTTRKSSTYQMFSLTGFNGMASQLEGIHNSVHTIMGGTNPLGHMSVTNVAAFDPIFWLHHCNVDRLSAMYQAIYPANQLQPVNAVATFARIVPGTDGPQDNLMTNLYPFKMGGGSYFKANEIKSAGTIWKYKYGYEEIPCESNGVVTAAELSANVRGHVNRLYSPTATGSTKRDVDGTFEKRSPAASPKAMAFPEPRRDRPQQPGYTPNEEPTDVIKRDDYNLRMFIDHSELPGSWTAHVLLQCKKPDPKENAPIDYRLSPDAVGSFSSFGTPYVRKQSMPYSGELLLTDVLIERGVKMNRSEVEKYLQDCLWIVFTSGDDFTTEIPASSLKTFRAGVYVAEGRYPTGLKNGDLFPTWGRKKYLTKVFAGKPGGIKTEKEMDKPLMLDGRVEDMEGDKETY